ncbi:hypothetical protein KY289_000359 [Solanum tuberosum]|nr:hypothetical protein KY289_000359 [Solanum tuberosum]
MVNNMSLKSRQASRGMIRLHKERNLVLQENLVPQIQYRMPCLQILKKVKVILMLTEKKKLPGSLDGNINPSIH